MPTLITSLTRLRECCPQLTSRAARRACVWRAPPEPCGLGPACAACWGACERCAATLPPSLTGSEPRASSTRISTQSPCASSLRLLLPLPQPLLLLVPLLLLCQSGRVPPAVCQSGRSSRTIPASVVGAPQNAPQTALPMTSPAALLVTSSPTQRQHQLAALPLFTQLPSAKLHVASSQPLLPDIASCAKLITPQTCVLHRAVCPSAVRASCRLGYSSSRVALRHLSQAVSLWTLPPPPLLTSPVRVALALAPAPPRVLLLARPRRSLPQRRRLRGLSLPQTALVVPQQAAVFRTSPQVPTSLTPPDSLARTWLRLWQQWCY